MAQQHEYDAIVIGGGHNGLVTAAYLARVGQTGVRARAAGRAGRGRHDRGAVARLSSFDRRLRREPAAAGDHSRAAAGRLRLSRAAAQPLVVHAAARRPQPVDGPRAGAERARDRPLQPARRRALSALRSAARPRGRALEPALSSPAPDLLPLPSTWRRRGLAQAAARRAHRLAAVPGAGRPGRRHARGAWSCSPARRGRSSIAGSSPTCSRPRWRPTRSSARLRRSPRRAAPTCCCIT